MSGFWDGPIYGVVQKMKATGNRAGVIREWFALVDAWAAQSTSPDAESVRVMAPLWQSRPIYTAEELAPMFPALAVALGVTEFMGRLPAPWSPNRLANALKFAGLPFREIDGRTYFIVEQIHVWRDAPTQALRDIIHAHG